MNKRRLFTLMPWGMMWDDDSCGGSLNWTNKTPIVPRMWGKGSRKKRATQAQRYHRKSRR